jgi:hypothetical protein
MEILLVRALIGMTTRITLFKSHIYFTFPTYLFFDALPTITNITQYCMIWFIDIH